MRGLPWLLLALAAGAEEAPPTPEERALRRAEAFERVLVKVAQDVRPCSVSVRVHKEAGGREALAGGGSGVVVKPSGLVLTNEHVVQGASRIEVVFLDGLRLPATVEQRIPQYDIALLQVRDAKGRPREGLQAARMEGPDPLKEGRWVLATGNPFLLAQSGQAVATLGIASGFNRVTRGEFLYGRAIQHDAEVNPGNSGGPLWDMKGRLLGINGQMESRSAGAGPSNSGVSLAIPLDQIQRFLKGVLLSGDRRSKQAGDLGLTVETARDEKGQEAGALVTGIRGGSPASETPPSGPRLQVGDVLESVTVRGKARPIRNATDYVNLIAECPAGTALDAVVARRRGGPRGATVLTLTYLKLGPMP